MGAASGPTWWRSRRGWSIRLRSWLTTYGAALPARRAAMWWTRVRDYAGAALPAEVQARLARADARLAQVQTQIAALDAAQRAAVAAAPADSPARRLAQLKGVGPTSIATLLEEGLVWRAFKNRRQVGGMLGFAPTHYASGELVRDRGISHAGNRRLQSVAIQLAWAWVQWQRASALTQWFMARFGTGKRARRIGIVAVARKLVIALWRCATTGDGPGGRAAEGRVTRVAPRGKRCVSRVRCARSLRGGAPPSRRGCHRGDVRRETAQFLGAACSHACSDRRRRGHGPRRPGRRVERRRPRTVADESDNELDSDTQHRRHGGDGGTERSFSRSSEGTERTAGTQHSSSLRYPEDAFTVSWRGFAER